MSIKKLSAKLINADNLTGDTSKIYGDAKNCHGDATGCNGDVTGIYGNISEYEGCLTGIKGNINIMVMLQNIVGAKVKSTNEK